MLQSLMHYLTANLAQLTLERTHPSLTSIVTDNIQNGFIRNFELAFAHPIAFHLLGDQMLFGNIEFFILSVARQANDLHPVKQCRWNIQRVAGGNKHHIREVKIHLQIMVLEGMVLLRSEERRVGKE